jgi:carbon monoxide dehydrogenase subunit G
VRFEDSPTAEVDVFVAAPPEKVWPLVSEINTASQFGTELQKAVWMDVEGLDGPPPCTGARFTGHNFHPARGDWQTCNVVVACEPNRVFSWSVGDDPAFPAATWRFELAPEGDGTRLRYRARMGPGPSGTTMLIEKMPDKEERIIARRLEEWQKNMTATVAGIKGIAEEARGSHLPPQKENQP